MKFVIDKGKMLPAQRRWWELDNFLKVLVGGFGSGKTYIGALRALWLSRVNQGLPGQYVSPSYRIAQKTIVPTLMEIMDEASIAYRYLKTDNTFEVRSWGGVIMLGSGDDPDSLRGPNLAWMGLDEPFLMDKRVFDIALSRVRHPKADHREIFLTGTPEQLNWGHALAMNDEGLYDVGVVVASTRDNHYLPGEYLKTLLSAYTLEMRQAYIDGKFVNLQSGRVYKPFDRQLHVKTRPKGEDLPIIAGIDFNVDYMTAMVAVRGPTWLHVFDEIRLSNANTFDLADALKAKYPGIKLYPDPTGRARKSSATRSDHKILQDAGFSVYARSQVPVRERVNAVNRMILNGNLTVAKCKWLIKDLELNCWRSGDIDKRDLNLTHAGDALGYMIEYLFPVRGKQDVTYSPRFGQDRSEAPKEILEILAARYGPGQGFDLPVHRRWHGLMQERMDEDARKESMKVITGKY